MVVNALAPSAVVATEKLKERAYQELRRGGRVLEPGEVAEAAVFLATKKAKEISDTSFDVFQWLSDKRS